MLSPLAPCKHCSSFDDATSPHEASVFLCKFKHNDTQFIYTHLHETASRFTLPSSQTYECRKVRSPALRASEQTCSGGTLDDGRPNVLAVRRQTQCRIQDSGSLSFTFFLLFVGRRPLWFSVFAPHLST